MARLNEPPAAPTTAATQVGTENVDALKRRFIRQNRELAKNNSTQSLRIRTLELDVSRLLAENLELRNHILHNQNELHTAQSQASTAAMQRVKEELQVKIAELSGLVDGIEDVQQQGNLKSSAKTQRKPLEGNWRERQPLSELMRDSQMPTISEDKTYPRRTMDAHEIQAIRLSDHSSNESPDLGPPPVARFDYADPVKNASPLVNKVMPDVAPRDEEDELPVQYSINLETRRKRKDGQPNLEIRRHSILAQSPSKGEGETSSILRTGAKRKLADRESEKPIKPPSKGDFTFSRKAPSDEAKSREKSVNSKDGAEQTHASPKAVRKVLGDKSVNMSPRKSAVRDGKAGKDSTDKPAARPADRKDSTTTRRRRISSIPLPAPQDEVVEIAAPPPSEPPPQTPAEPDFFSPTPSEPSTLAEATGGRGDTPPPGDLSALSIATDGGLRPSRRARAAVNYAEPSLISKMRRPDKKMVDALTGLQDPRRAMSASHEEMKKKASPAVAIKLEPLDDDDAIEVWKRNVEPSSPLTSKSGPDCSPATPPRPPSIPLSTQDSNDAAPSSSSATMTPTLLAAGRTKRRESASIASLDPATALGSQEDLDAATKRMQELDLYEFKDSSSPVTADEAGNKSQSHVRRHRRHSSVPKDVGVSGGGAARGVGAGSLVGRPERSERAAARRKSMML